VLEKVGPFKVNFVIDVEMEEVEKFRYIRGKAAGKDSKIAASFGQKGDLRLEKISDTETKLDFTTEVSIFGKLATLGNWIIKKKADEAMGQFVCSIKAQLENEG
jgi:carbon monoxide dehydrogenase subunit G